MSNFIRLLDCPICQNTKDRCWGTKLSDLVHCRSTDCPSNWYFVRVDKLGFNVYANKNSTYNQSQKTIEQNDEKYNPTKLEQALKFSYLLQKNNLADRHKQLLTDRGLNNKQIDQISDRLFSVHYGQFLQQEIAGTDGDGYWLNTNGLYIATKDVKGNFRDGQIRPDVIHQAKYLWGKSEFISNRLPSGNLPYQFASFSALPKALCLCEGLLKPLICATLYPHYAWIGFSGSRTTLPEVEEIAVFCRDQGFKYILLLPDANSFNNSSVLATYRQAREHFKSCGLPMAIADWGQLFGKVDRDCDEITWFSKCTYHDADYLNDLKPRPFNAISLKGKVGAQKLITNVRKNEYSPDWLNSLVKSTDKYHLINLPVGFGKTHAIGNIETDNTVYYVCQQPDYPSTKTLENWFRFPIRHSAKRQIGFFNIPTFEKEKNPTGNCSYAHLHRVVMSVDADISICNFCSLKQQCLSSTGDGYGFLYELRQVNAEAKRLRSHINSLETLPKNSTLILDEVKTAAYPVKVTSISYKDLEHLEKLISDDFKLYDFIFALRRASNNTKYGLSHEQVITIAKNTINSFLPINQILELEEIYLHNAISSFFRKAKLKLYPKFFSLLWETLNFSKNRLIANNQGLQIIQKNTRVSALLESASKVIFLDGTITKDEINLYYDIPTEKLTTVSALGYVNNIKITIVPDLGFEINNQTSDTYKVKQIKQVLMDLNYSIITWKMFCEEGDLTFLSTSRGSNAFQDKTKIALLGLPKINYGYSKAEWQCLNGDSKILSLDAYYTSQLQSELIQAIGRLRAERRRTEALECLIISDLHHSSLPDFDCNYKPINFFLDNKINL